MRNDGRYLSRHLLHQAEALLPLVRPLLRLPHPVQSQLLVLPLLQLLIYPATELENEFPSYTAFGEAYPLSADTMRWFMDQYLPEGQDRADVRLSPARETRLEDLPPAIVVTAGFDPLVDDGAAYAELLRRSGVDVTFKCYDSLAHGFTAFTGVVKAARKACEEIAGMVAEAYASLELEKD